MAKRPPRKGEGRPSKYSDKYCEMVEDYLSECVDETIQVVKQSNFEKGYEMYENKLKVKLPTIGGFSLYSGVPERTLYDWRDNHPKFSQSLEKIVKLQQERLLNSGLSGEYNSTIAKLILAANHGMSDRQEVDHTSGGQVIQGVNLILDKAYGNNDSNEEE